MKEVVKLINPILDFVLKHSIIVRLCTRFFNILRNMQKMSINCVLIISGNMLNEILKGSDNLSKVTCKSYDL